MSNDDRLNLERAARSLEAAIIWWEPEAAHSDDRDLTGRTVFTTYSFMEARSSMDTLVFILALGALSASNGSGLTPTEHMKNAVAYLYAAQKGA